MLLFQSGSKSIRTGIFGGTFDPVHKGHIEAALAAVRHFDLSEVWVMPAGLSPFKQGKTKASNEDRMAMVDLACRDHEALIPCRWEMDHQGISYTADTIGALTEEYPERDFFWIVGADAYLTMDTWYHPEGIFGRVPVIAAVRGEGMDSLLLSQTVLYERLYQARCGILHNPTWDISSSALRKALSDHDEDCLRTWLNPRVLAYIRDHKLYE